MRPKLSCLKILENSEWVKLNKGNNIDSKELRSIVGMFSEVLDNPTSGIPYVKTDKDSGSMLVVIVPESEVCYYESMLDK
jgi:hypothetical protein